MPLWGHKMKRDLAFYVGQCLVKFISSGQLAKNKGLAKLTKKAYAALQRQLAELSFK
jgi:hypothetical protein